MFEKQKYAFKYWKVITRQLRTQAHVKEKAGKVYEYIPSSHKNPKSLHTKHITFMNSDDFILTNLEPQENHKVLVREQNGYGRNIEFHKVFEFTNEPVDSSTSNRGNVEPHLR